MPFKTFVNGAVLPASDLNDYFMEQVVSTFADATARDAAITAPTEGQLCFLTTDNDLEIYNGTSWVNYSNAWKSYTPTIAGLTLNNGTISANYAEIGKTVIVNVNVTLGSTSSVTGEMTFTMPINHANTTRTTASGTAVIIDQTPATRYFAKAYLGGTPSICYVRVLNTASTYATETAISTSVPITWAIQDQVTISIIYQAA